MTPRCKKCDRCKNCGRPGCRAPYDLPIVAGYVGSKELADYAAAQNECRMVAIAIRPEVPSRSIYAGPGYDVCPACDRVGIAELAERYLAALAMLAKIEATAHGWHDDFTAESKHYGRCILHDLGKVAR